ncbi:MAG: glycosyltransferase [Halieaceae bacterium]|jgi:methionine biosynthesis protein MetW|nr:glycosyltransferase [Halieaceae bacterium]
MTDNRLKYQRVIEPGSEDSLSRLAEWVPEASVVMDLGTGSGELGAWLTREKRCTVDGIEMSAEHIAQASPHYRRLEQVDLEQADALAIFESGSYDRVVLADVLEHVRDRENLLRQAAALLKPGGELLLSVPNVGYAGVILDLLEGHFDYRDEGILDSTHIRFYTRDSLCDFLRGMGFGIVAVEPVVKALQQTEFAHFSPELLPASLVNALLDREESLAYQYILRVSPDPTADMPIGATRRHILNRFEVRLYWMGSQDLQHGEAKLQRQWSSLNQTDNRLRFQVQDNSGIENLRYSPADRAGLVEIESFILTSGDRSIDLCKQQGLAGGLSQNIIPTATEGTYRLLCTGSNPWLEIPLAGLFGEATITELGVDIRQSWPVSQDYGALLDSLAEASAREAALADQVVEQRAHRRGLAGEVALLKAELETRSAVTAAPGLTQLLSGLARRLLRPLWRGLGTLSLTRTQLGLSAVTNGERGADGWLALTGDSGHLYYPVPQHLTGTTVYFNIQTEGDVLWGPKLYTVVDGELHEMAAPIYETRSGGELFGTLELTDTLQGLVLAPSRLDCRVRIRAFTLRQMNALLLALEDSWHWLWFYRVYGPAWWWNYAKEELALSVEDFPRIGKRRQYRHWWQRFGILPDSELAQQAAHFAGRDDVPRISVVMPTYNTPPALLREAVESVQQQSYPHWELCIADDASDRPETLTELRRLASADDRIHILERSENGHISVATNDAISMARGDYVAFMDHDDTLAPDALYRVAEALVQEPSLRLLYSDEDIVDTDGTPLRPHFKPDWNPDFLGSINYVCHLLVLERELLEEVGGLRQGYEGAQDYDLILRASTALAPEQIKHIPRVLYHWRAAEGSTAADIDNKGYAVDAGTRALEDHVARQQLSASVELSEMGMAYRIRYRLPEPAPAVDIIMPTRDTAAMLSHCVRSVLTRTEYPDFRLTIVDNGSTEPEALAFMEQTAADPRVRVLRYDHPFNFAAMMNFAAGQSEADVLLLMNNDMEVINPDWLEEMVSQALRPDIGAVGAKLFFATDYVQHGGVVLGIGPDKVAGHAFRGAYKHANGDMGRLRLSLNYSAVTAACLAVTRARYLEVGGMDADNLAVAFNDVDFCLKLREAGYRNLWTPYAQLYHFESFSRGYETGERRARFERERDFMRQKWGSQLDRDPFYNPNLTLRYENFDVSWPPREPA